MQNKKVLLNNYVELKGSVTEKCSFSHEIYGEGFYMFKLSVKRLSDNNDVIPVTVSERLVDINKIEEGNRVSISGQLRSYNNFSGEKNRLMLSVFAKEISFVDDTESDFDQNIIFLNGFICKEPKYRTTPFGREISDILLAVNRAYNKSDYIPCIAWGRNARFSQNAKVGTNIKLWGRIQSRNYQKKEDENIVEKTAYEVSVSKIEYYVENNDEPLET